MGRGRSSCGHGRCRHLHSQQLYYGAYGGHGGGVSFHVCERRRRRRLRADCQVACELSRPEPGVRPVRTAGPNASETALPEKRL